MKATFNLAKASSSIVQAALLQDPRKAEIESYIDENVPKARAEHLIDVAQQAEILGKESGLSKTARIPLYWGGIFHDIAREFNNKKLEAEADKFGIEMIEADRKVPYYLHGRVGAAIAEQVFNFTDRAVLDGPRFHTPGIGPKDPGISRSGLLVTIADKQVESRSQRVRKRIGKIYQHYGHNMRGDMFAALYVFLKKLEREQSEQPLVHPYTERTIEWLEQQLGLNTGTWKSLSITDKKDKIVEGKASKA